ncbi:uncharacterized protein LOC111290785 isoform X1 [Durio zibethinus]|uniref:Uncharacterized protein LOC111290785 isoform X1 n=1 Tax=Durio zibethinus TaxID=66656 RepID=A0A6P5YBV3_DURZI|nr:uncharacterized protein LOC111290785 isoform X1 [Durio zibethinus]
MDSEVSSYRPPPEFEEDSSEPLVDLTLSDSTELFLIQWPLHQHPEINGQEFTLQLGPDGKLGSFIDSTGKAYDLVSSASKEPDATVILSSESESKIVGKISQRVSLVHYMNPEEYEKLSSDKKLVYLKASGTLMTNSSNPFVTPMKSKGRKNSESWGRTVSTHSSRHKSTFSGINELSKPSKRKHDHESTGSMNQPAQSHETTPFPGSSEHRNAHESTRSLDRSIIASGRGDSTSTLSGPAERSHKGKSKKKTKSEE